MRASPRFGLALALVLVAGVASGLAVAAQGSAVNGASAVATRAITSPPPDSSDPVATPGPSSEPTPALPSGQPASTGSQAPSSVPGPTPLPPSATDRGPVTRTVPVLMYHLIGDPPVGEPYPALYVSVADFTAQMRGLHDAGWRTITAGELGAAMAADRPVPARSIVVTFDDGNADGYTTAFPILQRYGFRATFFMIAAGGGSRMTADELATMVAAGMEIGNHTLDHRNVSRLSIGGLDQQVAGAELRIEQELAALGVTVRVRTFCYPSGHDSPSAAAYLAGRGYTAAFTTVDGVVRIGQTNPLFAPRLRVSRFTTLSAFLAMLPIEPVP